MDTSNSMTAKKVPPVQATDIPPEWPEMVAEIVKRDGNAVRGSGVAPVIEIKSLTTNRWHPLGLPGGGTEFANYDDRNSIMRRITNG